MAYRDEDIQKLLDNLKIEEVVGEFVDLKKAGSSYKGLCPFHADTNPSFMVNPAKNICKCFSCGAGGNPITFYSKYKNISFEDAASELAKKYGYTLRKILSDNKKNSELEKYYEIMDQAHKFYMKKIFELESRNALEYLSKRNFDSNIINENQLGYAPNKRTALHDHLISNGYEVKDLLELGLIKENEEGRRYDAFRNRIIFPIYSEYGRVIAFGGRTLETSKEIPKYINSPDTPIFKKGRNIYGIERKRIIKSKNYAIMMEGYMDVLSAYSHGFDTCVAPLGTALTPEQVSLLKKYTENIILSFDMDNAGLSATEKAAFLLKQQGFNIRVISFENAKDPDEFLSKYGKQEFLKNVKNSLEIFDFLYETYKNLYNINDNIGRQKFVERFKDFFSYLPNKFIKEMYISKLSDKLNMSKDILSDFLIKNNYRKKIKTENEVKIVVKPIKNLIEMEVINYLFIKPSRYVFFKNEDFYEELPKKILKLFFGRVENLSTKQTDVLIKEFNKFLTTAEEFSEEEKRTCRNIVILGVMPLDESGIGASEELQLFKSFIRYQIKSKKLKEDKNIEFLVDKKRAEREMESIKDLESLIKIYNEKLKKFFWEDIN